MIGATTRLEVRHQVMTRRRWFEVNANGEAKWATLDRPAPRRPNRRAEQHATQRAVAKFGHLKAWVWSRTEDLLSPCRTTQWWSPRETRNARETAHLANDCCRDLDGLWADDVYGDQGLARHDAPRGFRWMRLG
jgi:hypothetical protein